MDDDPLQPVPLEKAREILELLRSDFPHSLQTYGLIQNFVKWNERNEEGAQRIEVFAPHGHFRGVSVVVIYRATELYCIITIHSFSDDTQTLRDALMTSKRIKWNKKGLKVGFIGLTKKYLPLVEGLLTQKEFNITLHAPSFKVWQILDDHMLCDNTGFCPEVQMAPLDVCHSKEIAENWVYAFKDSASHTKRLITHNFGLGVFFRSTGGLVAWAVLNQFNAIGLTYSKPKYRNKGYAQLVVHAMCRQLHEFGMMPHMDIAASNVAALKASEKLKFNSCGDFFWVEAWMPDERIIRSQIGQSKECYRTESIPPAKL